MTMRLRETGRTCDLPALGAFTFYLVLSIAFFGRALLGHLSDLYFGIGVDPGLMMWSLIWWPHALANGINPLLTKAIWAPSGFNFAWGTSIPFASILASPLTFTLGPVATYNILCVLSLPINAFCAFLLCRYITRDDIASLLGGYIFGFSAFMLGQLICGHLHMLLAFPVPLCVYLALRRIGEEITARTFTLFLSSILVVEFLLSLEVFATMTMLGAFALFLAWTFSPGRAGQEIPRLLLPIVCAYGIALIVVSPYLYYFFAYRLHIMGRYTPPAFSAYPSNFLIPTPINQLGRIALFRSISAGFVSGWTVEAGAYIGLPLLLIVALYVHRHWAEPIGKLLTYCLAGAIVFSLGPILQHISAGPSVEARFAMVGDGKAAFAGERHACAIFHVQLSGTRDHLRMLFCSRRPDAGRQNHTHNRGDLVQLAQYFARLLAQTGRHAGASFATPLIGVTCQRTK